MKICVVTSTRAEYGLLKPLIKRISEDAELELDLVVTGTHLVEKHGMTINEIKKDEFLISHEIPILEEGNSAYEISITMANAIKGFAKCFRDDRPDMVVILGDRTEMLGIASAAMNEKIPIAHIHGGEVTEGAVDDCVRHALTKMSYLHFTSTKMYRNRVIQLGENPERVYCVGALGAENILTQPLWSEEMLRRDLGIDDNKPYVVMTYHPVTLEDNTVEQQIHELEVAMDSHPELFYVITAANADVGGDAANRLLKKYVDSHDNSIFVISLGMVRYLSAVKYASFVLGNSSSGILEAPVLGTPTVNIGDRQKGRMQAETIINCTTSRDSINQAIEHALSMPHTKTDMYGDGNASEKIVDIIKDYIQNNKIDLKKQFYDMKWE